MRNERQAKADVVSVTSAGLSHSDDIRLRQKRYMISQSVRIACVVLAALLPVTLPYKVLFLVGAIFLPWFGVVMANAGPTRSRNPQPTGPVAPAVATPVQLALDRGRVIDQD